MRLVASLCLLSALAVLPIASSLAQDKKPFTVDFTQVLIGADGKPLGGPDCVAKPNEKPPIPGKDCGELTLSDAAVTALEIPLEEDRSADPKKKFENDMLARKVYKQHAVVLSSDEISKIKDRIGKAYPAAVVGASWPLLDPSLR